MKLAMVILMLFAFSIAPAYAETVSIGVLAYESLPNAMKRWQPLADYLHKQLPQYDFSISVLHLSDLNRSAARNRFDFVITNPANYVVLRDEKFVGQATASFARNIKGLIVPEFAGVIFTRADKTNIFNLKDASTARIAAASRLSLGGFEMQAYAMHKAGLNIKHLNLILTGMPQSNVVRNVMDGNADVGFVRTGVLERLFTAGKLKRNQIRIINRHTDQDLPLLHSTAKYPEWPFVPATHTKRRLIDQVTVALLNDEHTSLESLIGGYFVAPFNYDKIRDVLMTLELPPYSTLEKRILENIWHNNKWVILTGISLGLICLILLVILLLLYYKLRDLNARLAFMAHNDGLTAIKNRNSFDEYLKQQVNICCRHGTKLSVILLDIDHFKDINDRYGHQTGDEVLRQIAKRLLNSARESDFIARYGGEEFAVASVGNDLECSRQTAERIRHNIASIPVNADGVAIEVTISAGVATWTMEMRNEISPLLRHADEALYLAKKSGRNRVNVAH